MTVRGAWWERDVVEAAETVATARRDLRAAEARLRAAMRAADEAGTPVRLIATLAGVSVRQVERVVGHERDR